MPNQAATEETRRSVVGNSMQVVLSQLARVISTCATVLITGETGTGKEMIAREIHRRSPRRDRPFVAVNCAALPENLLESDLFGHRRGAFTGADRDHRGLFEVAGGGTLFLDEIGEMPLKLQGTLLRVLQEHAIRPVGSTDERRVDVRIVVATHRDLLAEVKAGRFREDLYYRLAVFPVALPALRDRREDIPALAAHFLRRFSAENRSALPTLTPEALAALSMYSWPGNVRELENEIQRAVIQADPGRSIEITDLSPRLRTPPRVVPRKGTLRAMLDDVERRLIDEALHHHGGNKTKTAATLGITREGLHKKLRATRACQPVAA